MTGKTFKIGAVALAIAGLAWAPSAAAKVTVIYTLTNGTLNGFFVSGTASGSWTEGGTPADFTSNLTVTENAPGGFHLTYHYTGSRLGGWSLPSQAPGATNFFHATFGLTPIQAGPVSLYLNDFVYGETGHGTLTAQLVQGGVPEPASWATILLGLGGLGAVLRRRGQLAPA